MYLHEIANTLKCVKVKHSGITDLQDMHYWEILLCQLFFIGICKQLVGHYEL